LGAACIAEHRSAAAVNELVLLAFNLQQRLQRSESPEGALLVISRGMLLL
jgi:hypothetical protein